MTTTIAVVITVVVCIIISAVLQIHREKSKRRMVSDEKCASVIVFNVSARH